MRDKVIIVTGGSSGMGKAMATKFAEEGANINYWSFIRTIRSGQS